MLLVNSDNHCSPMFMQKLRHTFYKLHCNYFQPKNAIDSLLPKWRIHWPVWIKLLVSSQMTGSTRCLRPFRLYLWLTIVWPVDIRSTKRISIPCELFMAALSQAPRILCPLLTWCGWDAFLMSACIWEWSTWFGVFELRSSTPLSPHPQQLYETGRAGVIASNRIPCYERR